MVQSGHLVGDFVLLACAGSNITSTAAEILPKAREYKILSSAQEGFTVKEALKSEEELEQAGITVFSSQKGKLTGENGVELSVTQKVTDDRYADVYGLPLLRGTYFVSRGIESMDRFAVISDKAALALFKSLDAVGHEVNINQTRYTVIGVYEHNRSLLNDLSSDGNDMVFVPLSSQASVMEEMPVNLTVPLQGNDGSQTPRCRTTNTWCENSRVSNGRPDTGHKGDGAKHADPMVYRWNYHRYSFATHRAGPPDPIYKGHKKEKAANRAFSFLD